MKLICSIIVLAVLPKIHFLFGRAADRNMLARNLEIAGCEGVSLDSSCKKLLADKVILAWILQDCVEEYEGLRLEEIEKFIEGILNVSQEAVHRDETVMIQGACNEDSSMVMKMPKSVGDCLDCCLYCFLQRRV